MHECFERQHHYSYKPTFTNLGQGIRIWIRPFSMSASHDEFDEMYCSLRSISTMHPDSKITAQLEDIQGYKMVTQKSLDFIENLQCLYFSDSAKRYIETDSAGNPKLRYMWRTKINAFNEPSYVALSYTWKPSEPILETDLCTGGYLVEQRCSNEMERSVVRNCVFNRAERYMAYTKTRYLWIDRHCVEQTEGEEKEEGLHAMDRVYSLSKHPVALLARPIISSTEIELLTRVITGQLVSRCNIFRLSPGTSSDEAKSAIILLNEITSDSWFTRCWTFQENYRAGTEMRLLIPHHPTLNNGKPPELGSVPGELCVKSTKFHEEATKLCLAYQLLRPIHTNIYNICDDILKRVGKYTILLEDPGASEDKRAPRSMSPAIIADLAVRGITEPWDRLAIAANCCQYSVRLDSTQLRAAGHSLSLSMLVLCLLNGEILSNHPCAGTNVTKARDSTISKFLTMQFFNKLQSPYTRRNLTFNKGSRFAKVELIDEGILTRGHLWKINKSIPARGVGHQKYNYRHVYQSKLRGWRSGHRRLLQLKPLIGKLRELREYNLAQKLDYLVKEYSNSSHKPRNFTEKWMLQMAYKIAEAASQGKELSTAYLFGGGQNGCAIFITKDEKVRRGTQPHRKTPSGSGTKGHIFKQGTYVFTSFRRGRGSRESVDYNDLDKHVSLEVDLDQQPSRGRGLPRLFTKCWIHGLCFFDRYGERDVVFPWPASLEGL